MLLKTGNQKLLFPTSPDGVCTLSSEIKMEDASWDILSNFASGKNVSWTDGTSFWYMLTHVRTARRWGWRYDDAARSPARVDCGRGYAVGLTSILLWGQLIVMMDMVRLGSTLLVCMTTLAVMMMFLVAHLMWTMESRQQLSLLTEYKLTRQRDDISRRLNDLQVNFCYT